MSQCFAFAVPNRKNPYLWHFSMFYKNVYADKKGNCPFIGQKTEVAKNAGRRKLFTI